MGSIDEGERHVVIVAYDGSAAARQAMADAAKLLGSCHILVATVWEEGLAYVAPAMTSDTLAMAPPVDPDFARTLDRAQHEHAERIAHDGAALARSLGLDAEPVALPDEGTVSGTLLSLAEERKAAGIVVGSRGLHGLRARLEGSTSKGLLKHAPCPVIVVHAADHDDVKKDEG
jgi:nucleotide-binding universal stress UspA family protein